MYLNRKALNRAAILGPALRDAYLFCRAVLDKSEDRAVLGASTALLPLRKRPPMWALTAFAAYTDDLVDTGDPALRPVRYDVWCRQVRDALATGQSDHPICAALLHTVQTWGMAAADVEAYLDGLRADFTVTEYSTFGDLRDYIHRVDGPLVRLGLNIMEPIRDDATDRALALATAAQLADFVCDVREDAGEGRTYLPLSDLRAFGLVPRDIISGNHNPQVQNLIRLQMERVQSLWEHGKGIVDAVEPQCRAWLHRGIRELEALVVEFERRNYDISAGTPRFRVRTLGALTHAR
ncbi:phytoene/squalene synthase family protein [Lentzea sp. NPDC004789]